MSEKDKELIRNLQAMNFRVLIKNLDGISFSDRYEVYQNLGFNELKRVIVSQNGVAIALQG